MKLHAVLLFILLAVPSLSCAERPRIIFDTDITGDVDDVLALAMCHTLAGRGACDLLGVTISKHHPLTASFVDAQNTFHGRPDLPIGVTRDPMAQSRESRYLQLAESPHYPHDLRHNSQAEDAVQLLRKLLASQTNHSVIIVSVGIASNLANLLSSDGGLDLIRQKVVPNFAHELWGHTTTGELWAAGASFGGRELWGHTNGELWGHTKTKRALGTHKDSELSNFGVPNFGVPNFGCTELWGHTGELWGHTKTATTADSLVPPA
jgi:hypothetical protein